MKSKEIITFLIENARMIYKLYQVYRKEIEKDISSENTLKEIIELIEFQKKKEVTYLETLENLEIDELRELCLSFRAFYALEEERIIDEYIVANDQFAPILRILWRLEVILKNSATPISLEYENEDGNLMAKENLNPNTLPDESLKDMIIEEIYTELELETLVHFMNNVVSYQKKIDDKDLLNKLKQVPYDFTFIHPALEDLFLRDGVLNPNYHLFDTLALCEDYFDSGRVEKALVEDRGEQILLQLNTLSSKRKKLSSKKVLLKNIYLQSLIETLDEEQLDDILENSLDQVEEIEYSLDTINEIKNKVKRICTSELSEEEIDEYQKVYQKKQK